VGRTGTEVARHRGGYTPFAADLSQVPGVGAGSEVTVVVRARDPRTTQPQARGKQSHLVPPHRHATYHRTTGIWQTVWLEGVPADADPTPCASSPRSPPHSFAIDTPLTRAARSRCTRLEVVASVPGEDGPEVARAQRTAPTSTSSPHTRARRSPPTHVRVWGPGAPELYALQVRLLDAADGSVLDEVRSYAGLRSTTR
jgi:hypothetical protein